MKPLPDATIAQIEQVFGFTFTPIERTLLTSPDSLLDVYERQDAFVLRMALQTGQCPFCTLLICQRSASPQPLITTPHTSVPDDGYRCPNCQTGLTWHLGLNGQQWWTVTSPNTVAIDAARAAAGLTGPVGTDPDDVDGIVGAVTEGLRGDQS